MRLRRLALAACLAAAWDAGAAGKKKPAPPALDGKRVIALAPVENVRIQMPDEAWHDFGEDFQAALSTRLTKSGKYIVADPPPPVGIGSGVAGLRARATAPPDFQWPGGFVPAAGLTVTVEALSFTTGSRGERMMYGFDERLRTPYNDGHETAAEEFPLRTVSFEPNWFDRAFDARGTAPFDSRAGLDLGDGLRVDILFAWLAVKYARYRAELGLRLDIDAPLAGRREYRLVRVKGEGFFFDVAGAYQGYSAGIRVARRDAMLRALRRSLDGAYEAVERAVAGMPLTARIDSVAEEGGRPLYLLGTGPGAEVRAGTRYEIVAAPGTVLEVERSVQSGALARLVSGDAAVALPGQVLRQAGTGAQVLGRAGSQISGVRMALRAATGTSDVPAAVESIELPWKNLSKADFKDGEVPDVSFWTALWKSVVETALLPYRIWRYFMYDQTYHAEADGEGSPESWAERARGESWARQIGLDAAGPGPDEAVTVAVIDSGVDYNHPAVHDALWLNPTPWSDPQGRKDRYGWDFVSGDSRPFDDGYHGTWVASAVLAVAPRARILPIKVFNPWGVTRSGAILGAFQYAVDRGARVIVCGWATRQASRAIEQGVEAARARGVAVVAAAGDRGDDLADVAAYPAALGARYDNVLTVSGVDLSDELVKERGRFANFGAQSVRLAAPGQGIRVAEPRNREATVTTTAVAAALAAGALARLGGGAEAIPDLLDAAEPVSGLEGAVAAGRRLVVK